MNYLQLSARFICEAKGWPLTRVPALIDDIKRGQRLLGKSMAVLLQEATPDQERELLRLCRENKDAMAKLVDEQLTAGNAVGAKLREAKAKRRRHGK